MYLTRDNMERMILDYANSCDTLDQQNILPNNSIYNITQGLSLAFNIKFSKMFVDYYAPNLKNPLMQSVILTGLVLE